MAELELKNKILRILKEHVNSNIELIGYDKVTRGLANEVYRVVTNNGIYIVKMYTKEVDFKLSFEFMRLANKDCGCICLPVRDNIVIDGQHTLVFRYIDGYHKFKMNDLGIKELTSMLKKLHRNSPVEKQPDSITLVDKVNIYYEHFKENKAEMIVTELCREYETLIMLNKKLFNNICLLHGDLSATNILWKGTKISGVIDFDEAIYGPKLYDFVVMLVKFCKVGKYIDLKLGKKFIQNYIECSEVKVEEIIVMVKFYILKVILEKLYLADIGIIDLRTNRQMKDAWQDWYKLLKGEYKLWKEIGIDTQEATEYHTTGVVTSY